MPHSHVSKWSFNYKITHAIWNRLLFLARSDGHLIEKEGRDTQIVSKRKITARKVIAIIVSFFHFFFSFALCYVNICLFLFSLGTKTTSNDCQYRAQKSSFSTTVSQHQDSKLYIYISNTEERQDGNTAGEVNNGE